MKNNTLKLVRAGIIGALYIVLSFVTFSFSGGAIQFRIAEGLTLLPLLYAESIPALFIGCLLFNFISGLPLLDVLLGSLITLVAGVLTFLVGKVFKKGWLKVFIGGLFPVLLNAFFLPLIWLFYGALEYIYILSVAFLVVSQSLSVYLVGSITYFSIDKLKDKNVEFLK